MTAKIDMNTALVTEFVASVVLRTNRHCPFVVGDNDMVTAPRQATHATMTSLYPPLPLIWMVLTLVPVALAVAL